MAKGVCSICFHHESQRINEALARCAGHKNIAAEFSVSKAAIGRHAANCLKTNHDKLTREKKIDSAASFERTLHELFNESRLLVDGLARELQDPDNPAKFDLSPRGSEVSIIYDDWNDLNERGNPTKKKAKLNDLLRIINGTRREVMEINSKTVDMRKLYLEGMRTLMLHIDQIAKHYGYWHTEKNKGDNEELEGLRRTIQASADEHGITYAEEVRILFALPIADTIRADIKAQIISDLEQ